MSTALAMVPLASGAKLSRSKLAEHFATWDDVLTPPEIEKGDGSLTFSHGDDLFIVMLMPAPIPAEDLKGPIATTWLWPGVASDMASHKGHLIVTAVAASGDVDPVEHRKVLTQVVASVVASTEGALGVYWGEAGLLIKGGVFVGIAKEMLPHDTALMLWVDFRVGPVDQESGLSYGFTDGLEELGLMELVTENATESPGDLRERLMNIAAYLVANGPVIADGNTVGSDAEETITVIYGPSPFGHEGQVMRLDYSTKRKKKGWFGRG
jgi:hypothetical protein